MGDSEDEFIPIEDSVAGEAIFNYYEPGSALMQAVMSNNLAECVRLVEAGKSVNVNNNIGEVPLHQAVLKRERLEIFNYLISLPGIRIDAQSHFGLTPLHTAVESGCGININPIRKLLELGANVDLRDVEGRTPLLLACCRGWARAIHLLLVNGADATAATNCGVLPVERALELCPPDVVNILFNYSFDRSSPQPVHLRTLIAFSTYSAAPFFDYLLELTTEVTYDHRWLEDLAQQLFKLMPFAKFRQLTRKFSYVTDDLLSCPRQALYCMFQNTDGGKYLKFFCQNTDYFVVFDANEIYFKWHLCEHEKLIEYSLIAASYGSYLVIDLDYFYIRYNKSSIMDVFFHLELIIDSIQKDDSAKSAMVLCNVALYPQNKVDKEICYEGRRYFAHAEVPSLVELGRDGARQHIINKFAVKNHIQLFMLINWLNLPKTIKEILTFKRCIYDV